MRKWMSLVLAAVMAVGCGPEKAPEVPDGLNSARAYQCAGRFPTATGGFVTVSHAVWVFPDASVFTTCSVKYFGDQFGSSSLYRSKDPEATTAECGFVDNLDGDSSPGSWLFRIASDRSTSAAIYTDKDVPGGSKTVNIACTERP